MGLSLGRRIGAVGVGALAAMAGLLATAGNAPGQTTSATCGYGTGGPYATNLCWFNMTDYNDAQARSSAGQQMSVALGGGYAISFTITSRPVAGTPVHPGVEARTVPLETRFAFGSPAAGGGRSGGYIGTPGKPALYSLAQGVGTKGVDLRLSNITVRDSGGATVTGYRFVIADAENNVTGENFTWTSDKPLDLIGVLNSSAPAGCENLLTGLGTTTVTCTGSGGESPPDPRYDAVIVGADTPSNIGLSMTTFARSGVAFGILTSKIEVRKQVTGRVRAADSFDVAARGPEGTTLATATTGSANSATTGDLTVLPRSSGAGYTLSEAVTPGSGTDPGEYAQNWSCTNNGASDPSLPSGSGSSVQVFPQVGDDIECTVTNSPLPSDLSLEKTGDQVVDPGDPVSYDLTVTNEGPDESVGSTVTDTLPAALTNVQTTTPGCAVQGSTVTCEIGELGVGESAEIAITADAPNTPSTCFENEATVKGVEPDPESGNDDDSMRTCTTPAADLEISKSSDPEVVSQGGQVTYNLNVRNNGPDGATGVTVTDSLPGVLTNIQAPGCNVQGNTVTCDVGSLGSGSDADILITADAPNTPSTCFENTATVEGNQADPDLDSNEASARTCTTPAANLALQKTADATVDPGGLVTWDFTVTNEGPDQSTGSTVTDTLPAAITDISAPPGCDIQGQTVTCEVGGIASNGSEEFSISGRAPNAASDCFVNDASVEGEEGDPDLSDNADSVETCTNEGADLTVAKTADAGPHVAGDTVTYTISVANDGPALAEDVEVVDDLPESLELVSATPEQGSCNGADPVECNLGPIASGDTVDIELVATIAADQAGNEIENRACADGEEPDPDTNSNCITEPIQVRSEADLEISKVAETGPFAAGDDVTYTLTVTNNGPNDATDVEVTDDLPDSLTLVSATPEQGTCGATDPLTCDLGDVVNGESVEIELVATIGSDQQGNSIDNTASVDGAEEDLEPDSDSDEETINVAPEAGLAVSKTAAAGTYFAGDDVTFTLAVTNGGPNDATNVTVTDDLPNSLTLVSASPDQGTCGNTDPLSCDLGTIADGSTVEIEVVATIANDQAGESIENEACAGADEADPDSSDNCGSDTVTVEPEADLAITKVAEAGPFLAGDEVAFTLTAANNGPNTATGVTVTDDLPDTLTLVSATPDQGTCNAADPVVCNLGTILEGDSVEIELVVEIDSDQTNASIDNTASVDGNEEDPDDSNDSDEETIETEPEADLAIEKTVTPTGSVKVGDELTYTLTVTNNGPDDATNVAVHDEFDSAVQLVSVTPSQGTCSGTAPITCELGGIADGAQATIEVVALALHRGNLDNEALVAGDEADPDTSNNQDDARVAVKRVKVDVRKVASRSKADPGDVIRYEIRVRSHADVPLEDLTVCDKLPAQLRLISAPGAKVNGKTACWTFDLAPNGSQTLLVKVEAKGAPSERKVINTARLEGTDVLPERDKESVIVAPDEGDVSPEPCPGRGFRC
jgi:uncharacterized repeat protein (TIGR01451 family)